MTFAIGLGLMELPFSSGDSYWRWIEMCETGGVDSVWQTDRLVSDRPYLECISTMAAIAGATSKLKFGMNVVSVGLRDPLLLAKQCATIDMLSNGRLLPGFGIGNVRAADWSATGTDTTGRGQRTNEALEIISRLWSEKSVNFVGKYFDYNGAMILPKPIQKTLPMWIGGSSMHAITRTARYGTGWQAGLETPEEVRPVIEDIKKALQKENRTIPQDHYGAAFSYRFGNWQGRAVQETARFFSTQLKKNPHTRLAIGGADEIISRILSFIEAGASKFILNPIGSSDADIFAQTEHLINEVLPEVKKLNS